MDETYISEHENIAIGHSGGDKGRDRDLLKATGTHLEINQKLERHRVNDVDKTANDRSVSRIKLNVRCVFHFSFKMLGTLRRSHRQNEYPFHLRLRSRNIK